MSEEKQEPKKENKLITDLKALQTQADGLSDEIPGELAHKIELYCKVLGIIGRLHAAAVFDHGKAYADRKSAWGLIVGAAEGTQKDKEGAAEMGTHQARLIEAAADRDVTRWKNAFTATQELINAMKKRLDLLKYELGQGQ